MTKDIIIKKLRELKPFLRQEYSVKEIGLFGSYQKESFSDQSDIDIIVELESPIGWKFFSLEIYLEEVFNRKIDLVTKNAIKDQLKENILNHVNYI